MTEKQQGATILINYLISQGVTKTDIAAEIGISMPTLYKRLEKSDWRNSELFIIEAKFKASTKTT
jgi:DNA invertase Pin-like site-specific DNA recombinase